jgi:hypothetical protein
LEKRLSILLGRRLYAATTSIRQCHSKVATTGRFVVSSFMKPIRALGRTCFMVVISCLIIINSTNALTHTPATQRLHKCCKVRTQQHTNCTLWSLAMSFGRWLIVFDVAPILLFFSYMRILQGYQALNWRWWQFSYWMVSIGGNKRYSGWLASLRCHHNHHYRHVTAGVLEAARPLQLGDPTLSHSIIVLLGNHSPFASVAHFVIRHMMTLRLRDAGRYRNPSIPVLLDLAVLSTL